MRNFFAITLLLLFAETNAQTVDYSEIKKLKLPGISITEVQYIPAGSYTPPAGKTVLYVPAIIRVALIAKPSPESNIRIEIWLPKDSWNGRFLGTGNGGGAGSISYGSLASGVQRGFATANTDMGTSIGVMNAVGHPEIWKDFGYRATHEMTVAAKAIIKEYYKKPAHHSYFTGCSTGGQQALMEAQRYPDDYDGILCGAPANNRTHLHASFIWNVQANTILGKQIVSQKKMEMLSTIILQKYAGKDGGAPGDNFLTDPRICKFEPESLPKCLTDKSGDSCFTNEEIAVLQKIFDGPVNLRTGEKIYTPLPLGGARLEETSVHFYPYYWAFGKDFDYTTFDFDKDMDKTDSLLAPILNANNPDLVKMKEHGGKILMYTGTVDLLVPYQDALNYYERVIDAQRGLKETQNFFRLFLIPGMAHCGGGPGPNAFGQRLSPNKGMVDHHHDILTALIDWTENNIAPDSLIATAFNCCDSINQIKLQRPVYPYPKYPQYIGGNPNLPSSFQGMEHPAAGVTAPSKKYLK